MQLNGSRNSKLFETLNILNQWFSVFIYLIPFFQTRIPDLSPVHSVLVYLLIYWNYESNKFLQ